MPNEICPHCRVLRDTVVSTLKNIIKEKEDVFGVVAKSYSCSTCNSFIRCEYTKHLINTNRKS